MESRARVYTSLVLSRSYRARLYSSVAWHALLALRAQGRDRVRGDD